MGKIQDLENVEGADTARINTEVSSKGKGTNPAGPIYQLWIWTMVGILVAVYSCGVFSPSRSRVLRQLCTVSGGT